MTDFTRGWSSHYANSLFRHPNTTITITGSSKLGFTVRYDSRDFAGMQLSVASMERATQIVQELMAGTAGRYNR